MLKLNWRRNLMEVLSHKRAEIADRELVMEGKDMRVQVLTLGKNDSIP